MNTDDVPGGPGEGGPGDLGSGPGGSAAHAKRHRRGGLTRWLNRTLLPWIGPPPLGPYPVIPAAETEQRQAEATCPLCGALMSRHEIDRSGERTQIYHPEPTR